MLQNLKNMSGKLSIDWEYWRHKYVSGDDSVTFDYLSKLPHAPVLGTLKNRASKESWAEQRKQFRYQTMTKVTESVTTQQAVDQVQKLIDAAETITRHLQISKELQSLSLQKLRSFDSAELTAKDVAAWIGLATTIDRLCLGMATERQDSISSDKSMSPVAPVKIVRVVIDPKHGTEEDIG